MIETHLALHRNLIRGYAALEEIRQLLHVLQLHEGEWIFRTVAWRQMQHRKTLIGDVLQVLAHFLQRHADHAATEHVFLFIIVALDSFLLTPGTGSGSGAFFNPSYWPELGHRFIGNLSWAAFFIAAVAAIYAAASRLPADRLYHHWAARTSLVVGFLTLVPQIVLGAVCVESVKQASPGAFQYSMQGPFAWLCMAQAAFHSILRLGTTR